MDELAIRCKQQLETFRIRELKDVLSRVGSAKQGKKQVLLEKIMAFILAPDRRLHGPKDFKPESSSTRHAVSREEVARVIDDIFRKMRGSSAADLATMGANLPVGSNSLIRSDEHDEFLPQAEAKTRCPCGSSMDYGMMIQCDGMNCMVWQHVNCVIIPEKEGMEVQTPAQFYCELCRIQNGDPFSVAVAHPLLPTKTIVVSEGSSPLQNVEKPFVLTRNDLEMLRKPNYDLQIWCVLLNDKVAFRMHWPQYPDLRVNGVSVRVTNRPGQQFLGINGRDDGHGILNYTNEGTNRISFSAYDGRTFCIGIRIVHRLTVEQVLSFIPSEAKGEPFDRALARARRCIGGGGDDIGNGDDSDSDLQVVSEWVTVNLRCPLSGSRMKVAGRFNACSHMGCFDLHTFVELNQRARKWQCPICLKNYSLDSLIVDPFFNRIATAMKDYAEDVSEVEMKPDGCWRPKLEGDAKLHEPWRSPEGSINLANGENRSTGYQLPLMAVKLEEGLSDERVPSKAGIKRTRDVSWQLNGIKLSKNGLPQWIDKRVPSQSSSATASNDDRSVNQDPHQNGSKRNEAEVNSASIRPPENSRNSGSFGGNLEPSKTSELIVLSDTEEENGDEYNNVVAENYGRITTVQLSAPLTDVTQGNHRGIGPSSERGFTHDIQETTLPFPEVDSFQANANEPLDLFGTSTGDSATPLEHSDFWPSEAHNAPFEFLGSVSDVSGQGHGSQRPVRPTPVQAVPRPTYGSSSQQHMENGTVETSFLDFTRPTQSFGAPEYRAEAIESTRRLTSTDPSLRLFLPHQPARASVQPSVHEPLQVSNDLQNNWFSLSLGSGETMAGSPPNAVPPRYDVEQASQERRGLDSIASVLLDMSSHGVRAANGGNATTTQRRTSNVTGHRSTHRSKYYFRVDSDSD